MNRFVTSALVSVVTLAAVSHASGQEKKPGEAEVTKLLPGKWVSKLDTPKVQAR